MLPEPLFAALQQIIPQHTLSRLVGKFAESEIPWIKNPLINAFAKQYQVDLSEALIEDAESFSSFNDFFTRALKPDARTLCDETNSIASPADGAISELGEIKLGSIMQSKGQYYSLMDLLAGDVDSCGDYLGGKYATIYLSPKDYHRVHMPLDGTLIKMSYVPGRLFSVNQATANQIPGVFARNERLVCHFESEQGPFVMILVGAMIVAGIETVWAGQVTPLINKVQKTDYSAQKGGIHLKKGEEMGRFKLGSTVILLFPEGKADWQENLKNGTALRLGEKIGTQ
ncbi:MAG: phosphatidylserine decarboxylase [Pseudomonadales bacterium]|nr:phosphatidylserine decarboxylase [Pseudomonadales bacterium]